MARRDARKPESFETVRSDILDIIRDTKYTSAVYGDAVGWIVRSIVTEHDKLSIGGASKCLDEDGGSNEFDEARAAVFITDWNSTPPVTEWLVDTPVGRYVGMEYADAGNILADGLPALVNADSPYGRMVLATMRSQLAGVAEAVSV